MFRSWQRSYLRILQKSKRSFSSTTGTRDDPLIVVGSGVAGSAAALVAAETHGRNVLMLFAGRTMDDCNSNWAQGGIIYRGRDGDSPAKLADDIHKAGADLCQDDAVQKVAHEGPDRVRELLLDWCKVPFDRTENGEYSLCLEASHSSKRILHYQDCTGAAITRELARVVQSHPNITVVPETLVTNILVQDNTCIGVETLNQQGVSSIRGSVVLASGGLAGIYQHSTNPSGFNALGSSVALAERAGVATQDLEYVQFHPTVLYLGPNHPRFLLTEALRGSGAKLRNEDGELFMTRYHEKAELAPRDIVSRAVYNQEGRVFLDMRKPDADWTRRRFPTIQAHLNKHGLDLATDLLPVTPAAHYTCGGVSTNLRGQTSLPNLYAAGEAARTGLHGGNRLASTSLLEGLVFGASVADTFASEEGQDIAKRATSFELQQHSRTHASATSMKEAQNLLDRVKRTMWDQVGVVRTQSGLASAVDELQDLDREAEQLPLNWATAAVKDAITAGLAVAQAAMKNPVSAGAHFVQDDESDSDEEMLSVGAQ